MSTKFKLIVTVPSVPTGTVNSGNGKNPVTTGLVAILTVPVPEAFPVFWEWLRYCIINKLQSITNISGYLYYVDVVFR